MITRESERLAGILLVVLPTVMYGGVTLLTMLVGDPTYTGNPLRQNLWRAGHAHAGVLLVLALVCLRFRLQVRLNHSPSPTCCAPVVTARPKRPTRFRSQLPHARRGSRCAHARARQTAPRPPESRGAGRRRRGATARSRPSYT